ncbi:hypothetical protein BDN72DRAFT_836800 [Pluteus cervinus]|uniref:Uncharacterized protein n=1 Tax=Pluteus cervinus TaxID=181527 RepID=A0ACD3B1W3_9AGAR|nr:hypothetical protein BDN72DRAFT_836800 [Pluteus cervinus]
MACIRQHVVHLKTNKWVCGFEVMGEECLDDLLRGQTSTRGRIVENTEPWTVVGSTRLEPHSTMTVPFSRKVHIDLLEPSEKNSKELSSSAPFGIVQKWIAGRNLGGAVALAMFIGMNWVWMNHRLRNAREPTYVFGLKHELWLDKCIDAFSAVADSLSGVEIIGQCTMVIGIVHMNDSDARAFRQCAHASLLQRGELGPTPPK